MKRLALPALILACLLCLTAPAMAQKPQWLLPAEAGCVYPAGVQSGQRVDIVIHGQYFRDASGIRVSGQGLRVESFEYFPPLSGKELQTFRDLWAKAEKQLKEDKKIARPTQVQIYDVFVAMAHEAQFTDRQIQQFREDVQKRRDPKRQLNPQLNETVKARIAASSDAAPGERTLRVITPRGLSNPLRFYVGAFPEVREAEAEAKKETPIPSLPATVNGRIMPGDVDRFRFTGRKGQKLVFQVAARSITPYLADAVPGWFQAALAIFDIRTGKELAFSDHYRFDPDPVVLFEVPADGAYLLEIRDSLYRGREDFVYRATIGELSFVTAAFPLGGRIGKPLDMMLYGWNLPSVPERLRVTPHAQGISELFTDRSARSALVRCEADDLPEITEDSGQKKPRNVNLPVIVNGRIDRPGRWNSYRFEVQDGQEIVAEVHARRLGSPLDSVLRLCDDGGAIIATSDDQTDIANGLTTHHADSYIRTALPRAGTYTVSIGDTQNQGGEACAYRLRIGPPRRDFELRAAPSAVCALTGGIEPLTVYAVRRDGFDGEIRLRLRGAPKGVVLDGAVIPAGCDKIDLTLTTPPSPAAPANKGQGSQPGPGSATPAATPAATPSPAAAATPSPAASASPAAAGQSQNSRPSGTGIGTGKALPGSPAGTAGASPPPSPAPSPTPAPPPRPPEVFELHLEGAATIDGREIVHQAVPADDRMQAFAYHHLLPAEALLLCVTQQRGPGQRVKVPTEPVQLRATSPASFRIESKRISPSSRIEFIVRNVEGIKVQDVSLSAGAADLRVTVDPAKVKAGLKGNLLIDIYITTMVRPEGGKGRPKERRYHYGLLPAIPFAVKR